MWRAPFLQGFPYRLSATRSGPLRAYETSPTRVRWGLPDALLLAALVAAAAVAVVAVVAAMQTPSTVVAQSSEIEKCGSAKRVTCVVDGDTIWFRGEKIRMMGYDTPEPTTDICGGFREIDLANLATNRLVQLLSENPFSIARDGKDKYGRALAVVRIDSTNVGDILIAEGLARSWPDGREFWCE